MIMAFDELKNSDAPGDPLAVYVQAVRKVGRWPVKISDLERQVGLEVAGWANIPADEPRPTFQDSFRMSNIRDFLIWFEEYQERHDIEPPPAFIPR